MKILKQNTKAMQVEFTFEEYFRIANWLKHKPAGKIEIESRDALENFISMSSFINPKIAVCVCKLPQNLYSLKVDKKCLILIL